MSGFKLSKRLERLPASATIAIADKVRAMRRAGEDIIRLETGEPDFDTPEPIIAKAVEAAKEGRTHYSASRGSPELLDALVEKLKQENGLDISSEQIIITPGAKQAIYYALASLLDQGDEAIIVEPLWNTYRSLISYLGAVAVPVSLDVETGKLNAEDISRAVTSKTRLLILNHPNNPTGHCFDEEELRGVARLCCEHDLLALSDECYEHTIFEGAHTSLATLEGMARRTITIMSFSKSYAMTGWRLGYALAPTELVAAMTKMQQQLATCVPEFVQLAGVAALRQLSFAQRMCESFKRRRDLMVGRLNELPDVRCHAPQGTFYAFPDFSHVMPDSLGMATYLLNTAKVSTVPGVAFGEAGEGHLRLSFANKAEEIEEAMRRIAEALRSLHG